MAEQQDKKSKSKKIPALFIRSLSKTGFRRAGFAFTPEGYGIALSALTDEKIAQLRAEPALHVEECEIDAAEIEQ